MKNPSFVRKLIIAIMSILLITLVIVILILFAKNKSDTPESVTKAVLTKTYGASLQDYNNITNALTQSIDDPNILLNYLHTVYKEQLTDNGYQVFMNNRIPTIATKTAHEENSDLKVSSITLEPKDSLEGSKRYTFTVQVQTKQDVPKTFTYKGNIALIQERGHWKVDGLTPII